jgi:cell division protein FtsI (penicillin-binding protein 3)
VRRIGLCTALIVIVFAVLAVRVAQLQVVSGDHYKAMALAQRLRTIPLEPERGSIFDRNGADLATSVEVSSVYADPTLVTDPALYASKLAPVVGVDQTTLYNRLADRSHHFEYIARRVDDNIARAVRELRLPGVSFVPELQREYPAGTVASAIVGHVGGEGFGLDGLEALYNHQLQGAPGEIVVERDQQGRDIPNTQRKRVEPRRGTDLVLTIDEALQYQVESSLIDQVTSTAAKGGMAVIVDVQTGDVLAMATVQGATDTQAPRVAVAGERNKPLTDLFEPGSTNKLVTISTAIEDGIVTPTTEFDVPPSINVGAEKSYTEAHRSGKTEHWTTTDILRESSNVGTIMIAQQLGKDRLAPALRKFGLGHRTAIDFPGQPNGILLDPNHYYTTGLASSAIGYGVAVTAMQMLDVYATIANRGMTLPPRLLDATFDEDGNRDAVPRGPGKRVVSEATAQTMSQMMTEVVRDGTGACAAIPGYTVAGKTGTSRKLAPQGGYTTGTMASFVGFAPAEQPRFAAMVVLDEPANQYGAVAAAPVFSEIVQSALTQFRVQPNDTSAEPQYDAARKQARKAHSNCAVAHGDALQQLVQQRAAAAAAPPAPAPAPDGAPASPTAPAPVDAPVAAPEGAVATPPTTLAADTSQNR